MFSVMCVVIFNVLAEYVHDLLNCVNVAEEKRFAGFYRVIRAVIIFMTNFSSDGEFSCSLE